MSYAHGALVGFVAALLLSGLWAAREETRQLEGKVEQLESLLATSLALAAEASGGAQCGVSQWSEWTLCSADCGAGRRQRLRSILTQAQNGGRYCPRLEEWEACDAGPCAQDCILGDWAAWSACPSCGQASRNRQRSVVQQALYGGAQCDFGGLSETESCNNRPCPTDCVMDAWSQWSQCWSGRRDRSRSIRVQASYGGKPCGPTSDWEPSAPSRPVAVQAAFGGQQCPVNCQMAQWSGWSPPAPFFQAPAPRQFKFAQQAPAPRPTKFFQAPPPQKFVQQTPRSTDCVYGSWTQWSECTAACGESAFISRTRVVLAEAAGYGAQCEPSQLEEWQSCQGDVCQSDCVMGQWTSWSQCSADCGQGSRQRWRQIVAQPINGGLACGPTDEPELCNAGPCPVDCQMSQWSGWSQCSALCGPGSRQRLRSVLVQSAFGGQECGPVEDWEQCNGNTCATPYHPGQWSSLSQCPSCGQANRQRSRSVAVRATNGGAQCLPNDLFESESCNNVPCPVACQLAQWSGWSQCSSDCGEGRRQRLRSVLVPAAFGGQSCGPAEEWEACSNGPCARDCELGAWSSWSQCPSCGQASHSRSRPVVVQAAFGGQQCDFASLAESEQCNIPLSCIAEDGTQTFKRPGKPDLLFAPVSSSFLARVRQVLGDRSNILSLNSLVLYNTYSRLGRSLVDVSGIDDYLAHVDNTSAKNIKTPFGIWKFSYFGPGMAALLSAAELIAAILLLVLYGKLFIVETKREPCLMCGELRVSGRPRCGWCTSWIEFLTGFAGSGGGGAAEEDVEAGAERTQSSSRDEPTPTSTSQPKPTLVHLLLDSLKDGAVTEERLKAIATVYVASLKKPSSAL